MNRILNKYIELYTFYFNHVATPFVQKNFITFNNLKQPFSLSDICDLYEPAINGVNSFSKPAIESFFDIVTKIRDFLIQSLINVEYKYYPEYIHIFLKFIDISFKFDPREAILDATKLNSPSPPMTQFIQEKLKNNGDELYKQYINGESNAVMYPYLILYTMMNQERKIINKYKSNIEKIKEETNQ